MGLETVGCSLLKADSHPLSEENDENQKTEITSKLVPL